MVPPTYYYEFAISPDTSDSSLYPINYFNHLLEENYQIFLKNLLPEFIKGDDIPMVEFRNVIPVILK